MAFGGTSNIFQPSQSSAGGLFGTTTTTNSFGFGAPVTTATSTAFGFANPPASSAPSFNFGTTTQPPTSSSGFGFGAPASTAPTFGFGLSQPNTSAPSFGLGGAQTGTAPAPTFGFGATQAPSSTFNLSTSLAPPGTSIFGGNSNVAGQQAQQGAPGASSSKPVEAVLSSVLYCNVYGDERDAILARWNLLQAAWGTGKGFYSGNAQPVPYTAENSLCRFKAIGYSKLPKGKNEDGIVVLVFNKPEADVRRDQAQLVNIIAAALGNRPNVNVNVEGVSSLDVAKTELLLCVQERSATGAIHKAPAVDLSSLLWGQSSGMMTSSVRNQLAAAGVVSCIPRVSPSADQLREYLATPPSGIDPRIWKQAQTENPDPENFIPVPLVGFSELVRHLHLQEKETMRHQATLDSLAEELANLRSRSAETAVALSEQRRRQIDLQHRVLKVLIKQECSRKEGFALQPEEERLRVQLESIHGELSVPTQFRGRLNELLSQIRMRQSAFTPTEKSAERYSVEPNVLEDLKQVLKSQQQGMAQLMNILKEDFQDVQVFASALKNL